MSATFLISSLKEYMFCGALKIFNITLIKKRAQTTTEVNTSVLPYVWVRPIRIYSGIRTYNRNRLKNDVGFEVAE